MAIKYVRKSDLGGGEAPEEEFGRLVVRGYPGIEGAKVLDVLPNEVEVLREPEDLVKVEYKAPGPSRQTTTFVVLRADLDKLAPDMPEVIANAPGLKRGRRSRNEA